MGLIGPNGAGKTTVQLHHTITTRTAARSRSTARLSCMQPHQVIGAGVARTFQNLELFNSMSVLNNVLVGLHSTMKAHRRRRRAPAVVQRGAHGAARSRC
jgi:branched-chain amino acid transport system ATP-binding protein